MKPTRSRKVLLVLLSAVIFGIGAAAVNAQQSEKLSSLPKSFQTFYTKFRRAVLRNDKTAVASMTSFPFAYGWDAGDEGTYSRRQFLAKFNRIFGGAHRLFSRSNPTFTAEDNNFGLTNTADASHYLFEKKGSTYVFSSFVVEP